MLEKLGRGELAIIDSDAMQLEPVSTSQQQSSRSVPQSQRHSMSTTMSYPERYPRKYLKEHLKIRLKTLIQKTMLLKYRCLLRY